MTVALKDGNNNPVSGKAVSLAAGSGSSTITTVSATTNAGGQATFTVKDTKAETVTYTASDSTDSITITQTAAVTFTAGALHHFAFNNISSPQAAGTAFNITITAQDVNNNTVTSFDGNGFKAVLTSTGTLVGAPITTVAFTLGVLSNLSVTITSSGSVRITATGTGNNMNVTGTSNAFTVNPAAASTLVVAGYPSPVTAGLTNSFTVTAKDQFGNTATGYTGTVKFTSSDAAALLPTNYTFVAADNGAHSFSATLRTAGTQSMTATDTATSYIAGTQR
jgi:hypothetical protein